MKNESQVGDVIEIEYMDGEPKYNGRTGTIMYIDGEGQLHGDWGGLAVIPEKDIFKTLTKAEKTKETG